MAKNLKRYIYDGAFAEDAVNVHAQSNEQLKEGIVLNSPVVSTKLNDYLLKITSNSQYAMFTGGMYSDKAKYNAGNVVCLLVHWHIPIRNIVEFGDEEYLSSFELLWFKRTTVNPQKEENCLPLRDTCYELEAENSFPIYRIIKVNYHVVEWEPCNRLTQPSVVYDLMTQNRKLEQLKEELTLRQNGLETELFKLKTAFEAYKIAHP